MAVAGGCTISACSSDNQLHAVLQLSGCTSKLLCECLSPAVSMLQRCIDLLELGARTVLLRMTVTLCLPCSAASFIYHALSLARQADAQAGHVIGFARCGAGRY